MPLVTLLRPHQSYTLNVGSQNYRFFLECPVTVARDVAETCLSTKWHGKAIFRVEGLDSDPDEDVNRTLGVQLRFEV